LPKRTFLISVKVLVDTRNVVIAIACPGKLGLQLVRVETLRYEILFPQKVAKLYHCREWQLRVRMARLTQTARW
jgi:hypothetical protein